MQRVHNIAKVLFPVLLILSVIPPLLATTGRVQDYTTTTVYGTTTITTNMSAPIRAELALFAHPSNRPCTFASTTIYDVKSGYQLAGNISVKSVAASLPNPKTDFYLFNSTGFNSFQRTAYSKSRCEVPGSYVHVRDVTDYRVDFTFPEDGNYVLVFVNLSSNSAEGILLEGSVVAQSLTVIQTVTATETFGTVLPEAVSNGLITVGVVGIVLLVVLRIARRKSRKKP